MSRRLKDSGIGWIGSVPENWKLERFKSCVKEHFGGCWGSDYKEEFADRCRLCVRIADFNFSNQTIKESANTMRLYSKKQILNTKLLDGDLLVEKSGGGDKTPVGRSVLFNSSQFDSDEILFANFCEVFRLHNVNKKFFAYAMKAFYQNNDMHLYFNQTTGLQNLDVPAVLNARFPLPPLEEQNRIVSFLDNECQKIDKIISQTNDEIDKLDEYKKSIVIEKTLNGFDKEKFIPSGIDFVGDIPDNWTTKPIRFLFREVKEKNKLGKEKTALKFTYGTIIQKSNFDADSDDRVADTILNYTIVKPGVIMINCLNLNFDFVSQRIGLVKQKGVITSAYLAIEPFSQDIVDSEYACYQFKGWDYKKAFHNMGTGVRKTLDFTELGHKYFVLPPIEEQRRIAAFLNKKCFDIEKSINDKKDLLDRVEEYKKTLIYEMITGKKEVAYE